MHRSRSRGGQESRSDLPNQSPVCRFGDGTEFFCGRFAYKPSKKFGIKIEGTTVYIVSSDGISETKTQVETGLAAGWHHARIKPVSGQKIQCWCEGAKMPVEKTTNLPSGLCGSDVLWCMKHSGKTDAGLYVKSVAFMHDG